MKKLAMLLSLLSTTALAQSIPGNINKDVTQDNLEQTICRPGFTKRIRPPVEVTNKIKQKLLPKNAKAKDYELDHDVPLEVGGCPDCLDNLWLQPWHGHCNAKQKDLLENRINRLVCHSYLTLAEGQAVFLTPEHWKEGYKKYLNPRGCE